MHYDLLIQSMTAGVSYDPVPTETAFEAKGARLQPNGTYNLRLKAGDIEVMRLSEGGSIIATEIRVPVSDKHDLAREAFVEVMEVANKLGLRVVDPQLARSVVLNDETAIADAYMRTSNFAGTYSGVSSAVPQNFGALEPAMKPGMKLAIIIGAVGFALWLLVSALAPN
jgi:hypothetical protein